MRATKFLLFLSASLFIVSCGPGNNNTVQKSNDLSKEIIQSYIPVDKGFSDYIAGYTSGIIPVNASIEIRFTPEFVARADKGKLSGLFEFEPAVKGKAEWTDDITLVFKPSRMLEPGKVYTGGLNLYKFSEPKERLRVFPLMLQTLRKDFRVTLQWLQCSSPDGNAYDLHGELSASDFIDPSEVESYVSARLNKRNIKITWTHSSAGNIHNFTAAGIERTEQQQELVLKWDGANGGVKQKGTAAVNIPARNDFSVQNVSVTPGESQRIDIVFSDPVESAQEINGIIWLKPVSEITVQINSNIISVFPATRLQGKVELNIEASLKNSKGARLSSSFKKDIDFTAVYPGIMLAGKGVILPASENLIFPFKAANLKAVDLKIIKIFENNLPYFLQDNDLNGSSSIKRFGRPVYSGRVDLVSSTTINTNSWNIYSIDLADYIEVEPGVLYKVQLGMRPSYSLYPCSENSVSPEKNKYEEALLQSQQQQMDYWADPENYYQDFESSIFYRYGYNWRERENPCKDAFYSPDRSVTRSLLASNLGLIAKLGEDNNLHVIVSDLRTAEPLSDVVVEAYDLQMQLINSGATAMNGSVVLFCTRKPFLVIAKKDKDRNYLKTNDGPSLSMCQG
jgi:hypothetical protein